MYKVCCFLNSFFPNWNCFMLIGTVLKPGGWQLYTLNSDAIDGDVSEGFLRFFWNFAPVQSVNSFDSHVRQQMAAIPWKDIRRKHWSWLHKKNRIRRFRNHRRLSVFAVDWSSYLYVYNPWRTHDSYTS